MEANDPPEHRALQEAYSAYRQQEIFNSLANRVYEVDEAYLEQVQRAALARLPADQSEWQEWHTLLYQTVTNPSGLWHYAQVLQREAELIEQMRAEGLIFPASET